MLSQKRLLRCRDGDTILPLQQLGENFVAKWKDVSFGDDNAFDIVLKYRQQIRCLNNWVERVAYLQPRDVVLFQSSLCTESLCQSRQAALNVPDNGGLNYHNQSMAYSRIRRSAESEFSSSRKEFFID